MFIWGIKTKNYIGDNITNIECPECRNRIFNSIGSLRHFHIFWIPLFIFYTKVKISCSSCGHIISKKDIDKEDYKSIKGSLFKIKTLILRNFGVIVLGLFILWVVILMLI